MSTTPSDGVGSESAATFADLLRARRLELGLSRAELARYVGPSCNPSDIDLLETNRLLIPSWIRLQQLAQALETSVDELLPTQHPKAEHLDASEAPKQPCTNP